MNRRAFLSSFSADFITIMSRLNLDNFLRLSRKIHTHSTAAKVIPENKGLPIVGTALSIMAAGSAPKLHEYIHRNHRIFGPIFREHMGTVTGVFISQPKLIRRVFAVEGQYPEHFVPQAWTLYNELHRRHRGLFFMSGEEWWKYRKCLNKIMLSKGFNELEQVHRTVVKGLIARMKKFGGKEIPNLELEFYKHSVSFIIASLLGDSYIKLEDELSEEIDNLARIVQNIFEASSKLITVPGVELLQKLGLGVWTEFEKSVTSSFESSDAMIAKALTCCSANGLLKHILNSINDVGAVKAIVSDFLIAAGDTTAFTSQWALYLLGVNKDVQQRVFQTPSLIRGVIKETLRLYPPAVFISRALPENVVIDGYFIKQKEMVCMSFYTVGRNGEIYPQPEVFWPERWTRESNSTFRGVTDVNGHLPFGMGVRSCIGAHLAKIQLNMTTSEILREFQIETVENVEMVLRLVPVPSRPLRIKFHERIEA